MSLSGIDPTTFSVPSGQVLLYQLESTIYKKNSSDLVEPSSIGILNYLGIDVAELPCLVYESDLQNASSITPVDKTLMSVGSSAKSENAYIGHVARKKLDTHEFLNTVYDIRNTINSTLRTVTTMPNATSVPVGTVLMYVGTASVTYGYGSLYITDGTAWSELLTGGSADTTVLEAIVAANTSRIVMLEDRVQRLMEHLGLSDPSPSTYATEAEAAALQAETDAGTVSTLTTEATNTGTSAASI